MIATAEARSSDISVSLALAPVPPWKQFYILLLEKKWKNLSDHLAVDITTCL